jgi:hypothetical protein
MLGGNTNSQFSAMTLRPSVGDNIVSGEIAADADTPLNDTNGNPYISASTYTAQYVNLLKTDESVKVDLLHCFTAEHGQKIVTMMADTKIPTTTQFMSIREAVKATLPSNASVIGYNGKIKDPGNNVPTGNSVFE